MEADEGSVHVLEAVILAMVLLGAAYSVTALRDTGGVTDQPRVKLKALTQDALVVLSGLTDTRGTLLEVFMLESYHCASGIVPSGHFDCALDRSANMSLKLEHYLPTGAGYTYGISNGVDERILYRSLLPEGETVTASLPFVPDWNVTYLTPQMSCYDLGMDVVTLAVPIWHGMRADPTQLNLTTGAVNTTAALDANGVWRATLPALTRPAAATLYADVTATDGSYPGQTQYGSCDLDGLGPTLLTALAATTFDVPASVPIGEEVAIQYDLSALQGVAGALITSANVTLYEPLAPHGQRADAYVPLGVATLDEIDGTTSWRVPTWSLYGAHPATLSVRVVAPSGAVVDLHRVDVIDVALPTGQVPIDAPYRVFLQAWFPDWR